METPCKEVLMVDVHAVFVSTIDFRSPTDAYSERGRSEKINQIVVGEEALGGGWVA